MSETLTALPCGHIFAMTGGRCDAGPTHTVHGPGPAQHDYLPVERRSGLDRRHPDPARADPMSETLAALDKIARAEQAVDDLCSGRLRWEMRVPAEPDHDPDLIISDALRAAREALTARGVRVGDEGLRAALHQAQIDMVSDPQTRWLLHDPADEDSGSERFVPATVVIRTLNRLLDALRRMR